MANTKNIIRKTFPRIRVVFDNGDKFYQVDARRKGTNGKRETFSDKKEAEKRAAEIELDFKTEGAAGLSLDAELRVMALRGKSILEPFGKTVADAVYFYANFLEQEKAKHNGAITGILADEWREFKFNGNKNAEPLRQDTKDDIIETVKRLKAVFGEFPVTAITTQLFQDYLDSLEVGLQTKFNIHSRCSQFFNYCSERAYISKNPLSTIEITVPKKDEVKILSVDEAEKLMRKCEEEEFYSLLPYHAICLFGGLRPAECKLLNWEQIHLDEKQITVFGSTSKTKHTRNVRIENNLHAWLESYKGSKRGSIFSNGSLRVSLQKFRAALGYKINGCNPDGEKWTEDVLRHSYASYMLERYHDVPRLAFNMGNSPKIIEDHYKKVIKQSDVEKFWNIIPKSVEEMRKLTNEQKIANARKLFSRSPR